MREFPKLGSKVKFGFSDVDTSHVRRHFDRAGITHHDDLIPIRVEMTDCFTENPSVEADLLIDFAAHCKDLRKNADEQLRERFLKFLGSDKCTEKRDGGRRFFNGDWGVTIVQ